MRSPGSPSWYLASGRRGRTSEPVEAYCRIAPRLNQGVTTMAASPLSDLGPTLISLPRVGGDGDGDHPAPDSDVDGLAVRGDGHRRWQPGNLDWPAGRVGGSPQSCAPGSKAENFAANSVIRTWTGYQINVA